MAPAVLAAVLLTACGDGGATSLVPDEPADVSGVVVDGAVFGGGPALAQASDDYYEGMALVTDETVVVAADGSEADASDLVEGVAVELWVTEFCAESYPVQCGVEVVRVVEP